MSETETEYVIGAKFTDDEAARLRGKAIADSQVKDKRRKIPYRPAVNDIVGHVTATILLQQIFYWWRTMGNRPFYKFRGPCKHSRYVPDESWIEELGFGTSEFDTARKKIATKITKGTSKKEVLAGKGLASLVIYWTDSSRVTWYQVNENLYYQLIDSAYSEPEIPPSSRTSDYLDSCDTSDPLSSDMNSDMNSEENADPSPSGDAVQPALIQADSSPAEKEPDTRKELELALIDKFVETTKVARPIRRVKADYKADQTRWRKPIQVIAGLVDWDTGEALRLLDATLERLLGGALTVSSPLSLVETARSIKGEWARGQPARGNGHQTQQVSIGGGRRWG